MPSNKYPGKVKRICQRCGKEFLIYPYRKDEAKYCSQKCYHDATKIPPKIRKCLHCGKEFELTPRHPKKKFCCALCAATYRRLQPRKATLGQKGYKYVWFSDGSGRPEHIYIMEQILGRPLKKGECVHHKDFNRANNDPSNLQLMTIGEHSRLHRKYEMEHGKLPFRRKEDAK